MGAYLSEPNVEKISEDGGTDRLSYGASAMQGWRVGMEDSHNCITKLDENTSLFAVYDGHGGAEVAVYTAQELPKLLTQMSSFQDGDIEAALKEGFMKFDDLLKSKPVIEILKKMAGVEDDEEEKEEDSETEALLEEADLPLEQLVARYCSHSAKSKRVKKLKQSHRTDLLSPVIHKSQPRFPLTVENGSLQDGDGPVPNKTVPFDDEGDVMPKKKEGGGADGVNGPDGDKKREGENGTDSDDDDVDEVGCKKEEEPIKKEAEQVKMEAEQVKMEAGDSKNGEVPQENGEGSRREGQEEVAGGSGSCNGDGPHSTTKDSASSSGSCLGSKLKEITIPASDDDDSDEDDEDYRSEEEEEEEDDEDEEEDSDDEEDDDDDEDQGDEDDEEEEEEYMAMNQGREEVHQPGSDSGSTAVVAVLRGKELIVANIGDSRCVLSRGSKALDMSFDHKPEDDVELRRIENAGGKVTPDGRVNGGLNLSRAFGDHCYKLTTSLPPEEQMISAFPDIQTAMLTDEDQFMVIACDGIWNAMTSQEVIDFIQQRLEETSPEPKSNRLSKICEELFDFCLAPDTTGDGTGCDNMTALIVLFTHNGAAAPVSATVGGGKRKSNEECSDDMESKKPRH